jgi:hypothetical protein
LDDGHINKSHLEQSVGGERGLSTATAGQDNLLLPSCLANIDERHAPRPSNSLTRSGVSIETSFRT